MQKVTWTIVICLAFLTLGYSGEEAPKQAAPPKPPQKTQVQAFLDSLGEEGQTVSAEKADYLLEAFCTVLDAQNGEAEIPNDKKGREELFIRWTQQAYLAFMRVETEKVVQQAHGLSGLKEYRKMK